jgi:Arc/MetJ-type ribon-helix-helix transcriptional regulator
MSIIDIHLPDDLKSYLDEQVARRGFKDASHFVRALLEAEKHRNLDEELEKNLLEAVDGPFTEWTDDDVEHIRQLGIKIIERRKPR